MRSCAICKKRTRVGNKVSHANNKTKTRNLPNLKKVRAQVGGKVKKLTVCTRCIRSGKVAKAA